jgi:hypothetical protein
MTLPSQIVPGQLAAAILGRCQVRFCYAPDHPAPGRRVVSPHAVYRTAAGVVRLSGVQVAGPTSQGPAGLPGWRTFDLTLVSGIEALPGRFQVSPEFRPDSPAYRDIVIDCLRGWARAGDSN